MEEISFCYINEKKDLKIKYRHTYKKEIINWITINGENSKKLTIEGDVDLDILDIFQTTDELCPSMETIETESNFFKIQQNLTDSQNLRLVRMDIRNEGKLLAKIQKESKEIEKMYLLGYMIESKEDFEALTEMGRNIQECHLNFKMSGNQEISFLSGFPNLKKLFLHNLYAVKIDLFQLLSLIPKIEILLLGCLIIKEFKNADLSKLKSFGFKIIRNKHLENFEKFNSLERMIFFDWPSDWNKTDEFWDSFFKILPHLENVKIIEFVQMNYEDCFYGRMKSINQTREKKLRIRILNNNGKIIPKDDNDRFIIEEWSLNDYLKIYWDLF